MKKTTPPVTDAPSCGHPIDGQHQREPVVTDRHPHAQRDIGGCVPFSISCERPWLVATFSHPQRMVSWSLNRPGLVTTDRVAWLEVRNDELIGVDEPVGWFQDRLGQQGLTDAVGLMTARNVARHHHTSATVEDVRVDCLITLGLNNGETVGQRVGAHLHPLNVGTINILCAASVPLTEAALLEMSSLATQARTVALLRFGYRRPGMTDVVTGTGTDCIVAAAPTGTAPRSFSGMHTPLGEAIGNSVLAATKTACNAWLDARTGAA